MATATILDFQKFKILTVSSILITMPNFVKIGQMAAKISQFKSVFQNDVRPPSWICCTCIWTTHDEHFVICIIL